MLFGYGSDEQNMRVLQVKLKALESDMLEFKSTMRWNIRANRIDKEMEHMVLKSIAAFNNRYGGSLMIGVKYSGEILGLDADYQTFKEHNRE